MVPDPQAAVLGAAAAGVWPGMLLCNSPRPRLQSCAQIQRAGRDFGDATTASDLLPQVWGFLYVLIGYASYLVSRHQPSVAICRGPIISKRSLVLVANVAYCRDAGLAGAGLAGPPACAEAVPCQPRVRTACSSPVLQTAALRSLPTESLLLAALLILFGLPVLHRTSNQKALTLCSSWIRLNLAWQPIFFKLKKLGLAQFENLLVLGTAVATMGAFYKARDIRITDERNTRELPCSVRLCGHWGQGCAG